MIVGIKTDQSEAKASKLDKQLQSYGHLKFCVLFHGFYLSIQLVQPSSRCADAYLQNF